MRWTIAALALAAAMTSAQAQMGNPQSPMGNAANVGQRAVAANGKGDPAAEAAKAKANEKAYNAALRNLPDRQYDPWHGVR
jgi:hypothetical protein